MRHATRFGHGCGPMTGHRRRGRHYYGQGPRGPRGRRARRGDVRAAILTLLGEEPRNGYAVMKEIESRSDGVWSPSPGSIYPALQQLEDEGLIKPAGEGEGRAFELTDAGREALEQRSGERAPWESAGEDVGDDFVELMKVTRQVWMAVRQLAEVGSVEQTKAATDILTEARRSLYGLLAEDPQADEEQ